VPAQKMVEVEETVMVPQVRKRLVPQTYMTTQTITVLAPALRPIPAPRSARAHRYRCFCDSSLLLPSAENRPCEGPGFAPGEDCAEHAADCSQGDRRPEDRRVRADHRVRAAQDHLWAVPRHAAGGRSRGNATRPCNFLPPWSDGAGNLPAQRHLARQWPWKARSWGCRPHGV
jgi:hypothetical protein